MNKKGFTIIELLIVVLIIGILMAIVVPKVAEITACSKGRMSRACENFHQQNPPVKDVIYINGTKYRREL